MPEDGICKTFGGKRVVSEIPYTTATLAHYAPQLAAERRIEGPLPVGKPAQYREVLRLAFLKSPIVARSESVRTVITQQQYDEFWHRKFSAPVKEPSPVYLKYARRMMMGDVDLTVLASASDPEI